MTFTKGHALVIGVGTYQNAPRLNIPIAVDDAQAVANVLQDPATCGYPSKQVHFLSDEAATKAGILKALDQLASEVKPDDTVFFFYCGHGAVGEDNLYYLISHDAQVNKTVVKGTGVSGPELIAKLAAIKAERVLVMMNACYSGNLSPKSFSAGEDEAITSAEAFGSPNPPEETTNAILGSGQGRIIVTAARQQQKSFIGRGEISIFTRALVDGLRGAAENQNGYIGVYRLYEYLYNTVSDKVRQMVRIQTQEPELTVVKGVGPFPVALFKGAKSFGGFDESEPAPRLPGVVPVSREEAAKAYRTLIQQSGAINIGQGNQVNVGGSMVGGNQYNGPVIDARNSQGFLNQPQGPVEQNFGTRIDTGGGAYIGGHVDTGGGDFAGRDMYKTVTTGISGNELAELFKPLMHAVQSAPPEAAQKVTELQNEVSKGKKADDTKVAKLIQTLVKLAPDVAKTVVTVFGAPQLANIAGPITKFVIETL